MPDLRKDICSACGFTKLIVETEYRPFDKRVGGRDILLCAQCVALRDSPDSRDREEFASSIYQYSIRGTHSSVTDTKIKAMLEEMVSGGASIVSHPGTAKDLRARKVPKAGPIGDLHRFAFLRSRRRRAAPRTDPVYTSRDLRHWFRIGLLAGAFWCALIVMTLVSLGVLHR